MFMCSLRSTLCVQYKADTVACGIIFLAARRLKVRLPVHAVHRCNVVHCVLVMYLMKHHQRIVVSSTGDCCAMTSGIASDLLLS